MTFPLSPVLHVINGTIALWAAFRFLKSYKETGSVFYRIFIHTGFGVAFSYYLYSVPILFAPKDSHLHGIFYLLAFFPLIWALSNALRFAFQIWNLKILEKIIVPIALLFTVVFFIAHLAAVPTPQIVSGIVTWRVDSPFDFIYSFALLLLLLPLVVLFFTTKVQGSKARLNKRLFGLALLLGGFGGIGTTLDETKIPLLVFFYLVEFFGFLSLALLFILDRYIPDDEVTKASPQEGW
ncbi:MAG: hypothetical protein WC817_05135 [Patescibacteria group bacterium]|jgi:hypothetical protein